MNDYEVKYAGILLAIRERTTATPEIACMGGNVYCIRMEFRGWELLISSVGHDGLCGNPACSGSFELCRYTADGIMVSDIIASEEVTLIEALIGELARCPEVTGFSSVLDVSITLACPPWLMRLPSEGQVLAALKNTFEGQQFEIAPDPTTTTGIATIEITRISLS